MNTAPWITLKDGSDYDFTIPLSSRPPSVEVIAHSLSLLNRFAGHTHRPYSVAEHSCLCLEIARRYWPEETDELSSSEMERTISHLVRNGQVRQAIDVYPAYVAMAREQPLPPDVQIEIAHELYRQWLPKEAVPAYLRYLATNPDGDDTPEAKFRLGVLYARGLGRSDEAVKWLTEAAREHPDPRIAAAARDLLAKPRG